MVDEKVGLPVSSYEELCKIIQAYNSMKGPGGPKEVSQHATIGATTVSGNHKFLVMLGLVEGGNQKSITATGRALGQALTHNVEEKIREAWADIVSENDFLSKIVAAVRIRKSMSTDALEAHIAYTAGQPKNKRVMTGARTVIDILKAAILVAEENDQIVAAQVLETPYFEEGTKAPPSYKTIPPPEDIKGERGDILRCNLVIQLNINATPSETEGLGAKIRELIKAIENRDDTNKGDSSR